MPVGIFENHQDIGTVLHVGNAAFDAATGLYTVSGSGLNMWATEDAFHYAWAQANGDISLTTDITFLGAGVDPHRKACLIIRQSLDADSAYADVALHGDGLTSLQFRDTNGGTTHEVQANVSAPQRVRLEKRGKYVRLYVGTPGEELTFSGAATQVTFTEPFYIGLGVCSHNKDVVETATFSNVELTPLPTVEGQTATLFSTLETQIIASTDRRVVYSAPIHFEAPNWHPDGTTLVYNSRGRIYKIPVTGGEPTLIDTGFAIRCNNDHGISPDGQTLVISDQSQEPGHSLIYTLPLTGGTPTRITPNGPSYWHGISPDGKMLAYCAQRDGEYDIYTIPTEGGDETRLTTAPGLDDGPEYSHDGQYIYFNSERTGKMQIWRMKTDGADQEQITTDEYNNWFAHLSPDGRGMAFLSYEPDVKGHPPNKDVQLRLMALDTKEIRVLAKVFGGQGTINVPSWSPDSKRIAFVTYQLVE